MHTTIQILDEIAEKHGDASDYRIGKLMLTSSQTVNNWRKGRTSLNQAYAMKAAELLGWEPAYVIACVEHERAEKDTRLSQIPLAKSVLKVWERIAYQFAPGQTVQVPRRVSTAKKRARVAGMLLATGITALSALAPPQAVAGQTARSVYYGKSRPGRVRPLIGRPRRTRRRRPLQLPAPAPITAAI